MARFSDDPRMEAILTRLHRGGVDVNSRIAVILALEDEIDRYRESIRILREQHKSKPVNICEDRTDNCSDRRHSNQTAYMDGFREGVSKMGARAAVCLMTADDVSDRWELVFQLIGYAGEMVRRDESDG